MKKLFTLLATSLLVFGLVGCSGDSGYAGPTELTEATSREVTTMDYVVTALATDHEINANLVDGLLENDKYGHIQGALAESWEHNEDSTVWTFKLKQGVKWVTSLGEEYAEVKAEDFVTGLRHAVEFDSGTSYLMDGTVVGYHEYLASEFTDEDWEKVGVKALDDYTVEYTLTAPTPYFDSMTTYAILYPINKDFLESKGEGCKLGTPDKETCAFGTTELDSILYNGAYILTKNDAKSSTELTKNESYWDAEHTYLTKVTRIYDEGEDPYSIMRGFEDGTYSAAALNPNWADYKDYQEKYKDSLTYTLPNASVFGLVFNFDRDEFKYTNYADDETLRNNTREAILNTNFRKAIRAAWDRVSYLEVDAPHDLAVQTLRNINNFPDAGLTSDGTPYFELVNQAYKEATGEEVNLNDGEHAFFGKENALKYIDAAKAEGVKFPVHLDMLVVETSDRLVKQANSMKQSIESNTDGQIIIELVLEDSDTVQSVAYYNQDEKKSDYDISTFTGWSPDYADPKSFVDIYSSTAGYYLCSMGLLPGTGDQEVKDKIGLSKYEELYRTADKVTDNMDERYKAYAKADSFLVENALFVPGYQDARSERVTKVVPFTRPFSNTGISQYKYKSMQLQEEVVTTEQYNAAQADWESKR